MRRPAPSPAVRRFPRLPAIGLVLPALCALILGAPAPSRGDDPANATRRVPRASSLHADFMTDDWKLNHIWSEAIPSILSRQTPFGAVVESTPESGLYPNIFPRAIWPILLTKAGYLQQVRPYLDFMWTRQAKDGSFANFYKPADGKGMGVREEDGGSYIVWATEVWTRYGGDIEYARANWKGISRALDFVLTGYDPKSGLLGSTAGTMETPGFESGHNLYHQLISLVGLRSGIRLARILNDGSAEKRWEEAFQNVQTGIRTNLVSDDGSEYVYKKGDTTNLFWSCFLLFTYWDLVTPHERILENTIAHTMRTMVYDQDGLLALRPFSITSPTGNGPWLGQWGQGMIVPHYLKGGDLAEADRWFRSFVHLVDTSTFLVPEHINLSAWDSDGGAPDYPGYGLYPDESAWVDPGNLFSEATAMMMVFTMVDIDPADPAGNLYLRIPPSLKRVEANNLRGPGGYLSVRYSEEGGAIGLDLSGSGWINVHLVGRKFLEGTKLSGGETGAAIGPDDRGDIVIRVDLPGRTFLDLGSIHLEVTGP